MTIFDSLVTVVDTPGVEVLNLNNRNLASDLKKDIFKQVMNAVY